MYTATNNIRNQLFKPWHSSSYNNNDIGMLDESTSIPPSELLATIPDAVHLIKIDVLKAYTSEFDNMI
jgi:hypothetical protein